MRPKDQDWGRSETGLSHKTASRRLIFSNMCTILERKLARYISKCFQLQAGFAPLTPHQGLCPWTPLGAQPPDPHERQRSGSFFVRNRSLPVPESTGYLKTLGSPWLRSRFLFSKIFNGHLFGWTLWMYGPNLKSVYSLPVPEIIAGRAYLKTLGSPWIRRSRSSMVIDFGTNRKRICDFLLVRCTNLGPIL